MLGSISVAVIEVSSWHSVPSTLKLGKQGICWNRLDFDRRRESPVCEIKSAENLDTDFYVVDETGKDDYEVRDVWRSEAVEQPPVDIRVMGEVGFKGCQARGSLKLF